MKLHVGLSPWWSDVKNAIGGGPRLVSGGVPVFQAGEAFLSSQLVPRNPRTAVGQLGNGRILLLAVDGRSSWSAGVTNSQLARLMANLGARTAMALDSGGSTTMAFDGQVLNRPSDRDGERAVGDALMIRLSGKEPDVDVQIDFIGVRPGEKLHEELWAGNENAEPTTHPKILRCAGMPVDPAWLEDELAELERLVETGETLDVVNRLGLVVRAPRRVSAEAAAPETV